MSHASDERIPRLLAHSTDAQVAEWVHLALDAPYQGNHGAWVTGGDSLGVRLVDLVLYIQETVTIDSLPVDMVRMQEEQMRLIAGTCCHKETCQTGYVICYTCALSRRACRFRIDSDTLLPVCGNGCTVPLVTVNMQGKVEEHQVNHRDTRVPGKPAGKVAGHEVLKRVGRPHQLPDGGTHLVRVQHTDDEQRHHQAHEVAREYNRDGRIGDVHARGGWGRRGALGRRVRRRCVRRLHAQRRRGALGRRALGRGDHVRGRGRGRNERHLERGVLRLSEVSVSACQVGTNRRRA